MQRRTSPSHFPLQNSVIGARLLRLLCLAISAAPACTPGASVPSGTSPDLDGDGKPDNHDGTAAPDGPDGPDGPGGGDPDFPVSACGEGAPPAEFSLCSGCHGEGGAAPSLFDFAGSEADFRARVRSGGSGMPPFAESLIGDD